MKRRRVFLQALVLTASLVASVSNEARATGIFEDAMGDAGFLCAPFRNSVHSRLLVTDATGTEASMAVLAADFRVNSWFLFEVEIPYITAHVGDQAIESGFGDLRVRGRFSLFHRPGRVLSLAWELGTGTGTTGVFPYASQAIEIIGGIAWSDTLETIQYWAFAGGESINRAPDELIDQRVLLDLGRISGGIAVPLGPVDCRLGTSFLFLDDGTVRDHYFAQVGYDHRDILRFVAGAQIEAASESARSSDAAASVGMYVFF